MTQESHANGPFDWSPSAPAAPATITVPSYDSDGAFTVSWASSSGATEYELEEATQEDYSDAYVVYTGSNTSKDITGKSEGFYYYRVLARNGAGDSTWTEGGPCEVSAPGIRVSPDLGWADIESMLDAAENDAVQSIDFTEMTVSSDIPKGYLGPYYKVLDVDGTNYELPTAAINMLGGHEMKYYYRARYEVGFGDISHFKLRLEAPPVEEEE